MRDEIRHIIEHMSPIELCMLEDRGAVLPPVLALRAATYRRNESDRVLMAGGLIERRGVADAERGPTATERRRVG